MSVHHRNGTNIHLLFLLLICNYSSLHRRVRWHFIPDFSNEVKLKAGEITALKSSKDILIGDLRAAGLKVEHLQDQICIHEREFVKLEHDSKREYIRLTKEVADKDEELRMYLDSALHLNKNKKTVEVPFTF